MTILEIIICVLVAVSVIRGVRRGLSGQILRVVGLVAGGIAAASFKDQLAPKLEAWFPTLGAKVAEILPELATKLYVALAFVAIWLAVIIAAWLLSLLVKGKQSSKSGSVNKLLGALLAVAIWVVMLSCLFALYNLVPTDNERITALFEPLNKQINGGVFLKYLADAKNPIGQWVLALFM